jgi:transcriptional regulator with XRE-family HTH domain
MRKVVNFLKTYSRLIKTRRNLKNITQNGLAIELGQTGGPALVSKWESGTHVPSCDTADKLSKILGGESYEYRLTNEHKED